MDATNNKPYKHQVMSKIKHIYQITDSLLTIVV